jgi:hypothetical protein
MFAPPVARPKTRPQPRPAAGEALAPASVHATLRQPGEPLEAGLRGEAEPRFGMDFGRVRIHTGAAAADSARAVDAAAYTVGRDIVFGAGRFRPGSASGQALLHHELMHVAQQRSAVAASPLMVARVDGALERDAGLCTGRLMVQRQPAHLADFPADERTKVVVHPAPLDTQVAEVIAESFDPDKAGTYPEVAGTRIEAGSVSDKDQRKALENTARYLIADKTVSRLRVNETMTIPIKPMGKLVRFTHLAHAGKPASRIVVIEVLGAIPAASPQAQKTSEAKFKAKTFKLKGVWSANDKAILYEALAPIPDAALVAGLALGRDETPGAGKAGEGAKSKALVKGEAGRYDPDTHTLWLHNNAFEGDRDTAVEDIRHELGHVADYAPVTAAKAAYEASGKTAEDEATRKAARRLTGSDDATDTPTDITEFRTAAKKDGVAPETGKRQTVAGTAATLKGSPTSYGDTDWKELFADSFAMFVRDPDLLKAIRPNIFEYFAKKYPPAAPATSSGSATKK